VSPADGSNVSAPLDANAELHSLAAGVRFFAGALTVASGILDVNVCAQVTKYKLIFEEALPGQILSFPTDLIIRFHFVWLAVSILLPLVSLLIIFFVRSHRTTLILASLLIAGSVLHANITSASLFSPFLRMMNGVSGNP
jgi:hypothetical protein